MVEKFLFKKVEMWFVLILAMVGIIGSLLFAGAVRHAFLFDDGGKLGKLAPVVESIAAFPATVRDILVGKGGSADLVKEEQRFEGHAGFQFNYAAGTRPDLGYVLVNRYDGDEEYSVSELWDLNSQQLVHTWNLSNIADAWNALTLESERFDPETNNTASESRTFHATVSKDGIVYSHTYDAPLLAIDACSDIKILNQSRHYHHSLERDHEGNFWMPSRIDPKSVNLGTNNFQDDGITLISPTGEVLFEKSVVQLLDDNGLGYLLFGAGPHNSKNDDPIHLNDIQPALTDGKFWKQGDVFLSIRNLSLIVLYRPSTNQVLWYQRGPWLHEHDVDILNDHQIAIFNNNINLKTKDYVVDGTNSVLVYDFQTKQVTSPWQAGFEKLELRTKSEGRGEIVDKEVFVEETNYGRLIQFLPDGTVSWQFVNRATDGKIYLVSWSRLISRELGDQVRAAVAQRSCS
jgi:hypothetical protein